MIIKILGCGDSKGVPMLSDGYGACDSKNSKNNRLRPSALVYTENANILIDTTPEVRLQLLNANVDKLDAILLTHPHYDHIGGLPDVIGYYYKTGKKIPLYVSRRTLKGIVGSFPYLVNEQGESDCFDVHLIKENHPFYVNNTKITPLLGHHGRLYTFGFLIDKMCYFTDFNQLTDEALSALHQIKTLILGVAKRHSYAGYKHLTLDEALKLINQIDPEKVFLTHLSSQLDYDTLCHELPDFINPCYDGMEITC